MVASEENFEILFTILHKIYPKHCIVREGSSEHLQSPGQEHKWSPSPAASKHFQINHQDPGSGLIPMGPHSLLPGPALLTRRLREQ